jgi:hypothetical protein
MLSTVILFVLTFGILGLLLGIAASYDSATSIRFKVLPENIEDRDPEIQRQLFEDCIKDARFDGELTDDEYYRCAYSIYD